MALFHLGVIVSNAVRQHGQCERPGAVIPKWNAAMKARASLTSYASHPKRHLAKVKVVYPER